MSALGYQGSRESRAVSKAVAISTCQKSRQLLRRLDYFQR